MSLVPQLWLQQLAISRTGRHPLRQSVGSERQTTSPAEKPVQFLNLTCPAMAVPTSPWLYFLPAQRIFYAGWILFYAPLDCFCNDGSAIQVWVMKGRRRDFEIYVQDWSLVQDAMWIKKTFKREQKDVEKETKRLWFRGKVKAVIVFLGSGKNWQPLMSLQCSAWK